MSTCGAGDLPGKLKAVARNWVQGRGGNAPDGDPDTVALLTELECRHGRVDDSIPEISPDEAPAVMLFLSLSTQWRVEPMSGRYLGIDYAVIPPTAAMLDLCPTPALLMDIRVMEREALDALAQRR